MKKLISLIFIAIIVQVFSFTTCFANNQRSMTGLVWDDVNSNGIQELNEQGISGAVVHVQSATGEVVTTVVTDAKGYFHTGELAYGDYVVWSEINGAISAKQTMEIGEVGGSGILTIPVVSNMDVGSFTVASQIFLPLIQR